MENRACWVFARVRPRRGGALERSGLPPIAVAVHGCAGRDPLHIRGEVMAGGLLGHRRPLLWSRWPLRLRAVGSLV